MLKIDKRKKYYCVLDTETTNNTMGKSYNDGLTYDIGFGIYDKKGKEYLHKSWVVTDIFDKEQNLMQSAYYSNKLPQYHEELATGSRERITICQAKKQLRLIMESFNIKDVYAFNMDFDRQVLGNTIRYVTKSKIRYFFPYGTQFKCIWNMACQVLGTQKTFIKQNVTNAKGNLITNAERFYQYITGDKDFKEKHTGLEDVRIEATILAKCLAQHKKMDRNINKKCWNIPNKARKELLQM